MNKKLILILSVLIISKLILILSVLIISSCGLSEEQCLDTAKKQLKEWCQLEYSKGINAGIDLGQSPYKGKTCVNQEDGDTLVIKPGGYSMLAINPYYPSCNQSRQEAINYMDSIKCYDDSVFMIGNSSIFFTIAPNLSMCLNVYLPLEEFCRDNGMEQFKGDLFEDTGCLDSDGEYHYYYISYNNDTHSWVIGNESLNPEWSCD